MAFKFKKQYEKNDLNIYFNLHFTFLCNGHTKLKSYPPQREMCGN